MRNLKNGVSGTLDDWFNSYDSLVTVRQLSLPRMNLRVKVASHGASEAAQRDAPSSDCAFQALDHANR